MASAIDSAKTPESAGLRRPTRAGPGIRWYLLGVGAIVLVVPILGVLGMRITDRFLARQTERELIAQAVVIGEIYRDAWLRQSAAPATAPLSYRAPGRSAQRYTPIDPTLDLDEDEVAPEPAVLPTGTGVQQTTAGRAGAEVAALLRRAQTFNLSAIRLLDQQGCVIATTRGDEAKCLSDLPEVQRARAGRYASVLRPRISHEPLASPWDPLRRRGDIRIFIAMPIFDSEAVIGIVRASRTSVDTLTTLWRNRRWLLIVSFGCLAVAIGAGLLLARAIASPLRRLTRGVQTAESTGELPHVALGRLAPREVAALGDALAAMSTRLKERADYIREFAAAVSHELKTPVSAIHGAAELLADGWEGMDVGQRQRFLANIQGDTLRMERLVSRLLELARAETASPASAAPQPVDVKAFFEEFSARHGADVQVRFEEAPEACVIERELLESAVGNLLENALRHGAGKPVELTVGCERARLRIDVKDRGPGISAKNRERIFSRFFTTERDRGGTGLGLAISRSIARARGGDVSFTSDESGTTFTIVV